MNVKPGDLAKLILDPYFGENVGRQLVVLTSYNLADKYLHPDGSVITEQAWLCRTLQPVRAFNCGKLPSIIVEAGKEFVTLDSYLKRIDPPEGTEELYRDVPTEEEKDLGLIVLSERLP
jgi:hypothetical protein